MEEINGIIQSPEYQKALYEYVDVYLEEIQESDNIQKSFAKAMEEIFNDEYFNNVERKDIADNVIYKYEELVLGKREKNKPVTKIHSFKEFLLKINKIISTMKLTMLNKYSIIFLVVIILAHVVFIMNRSYSVNREISGVNKEEYTLFIKSLPEKSDTQDGTIFPRAEAVKNTEITYFQIMPEYSINILYYVYLSNIVFILVTILINKKLFIKT